MHRLTGLALAVVLVVVACDSEARPTDPPGGTATPAPSPVDVARPVQDVWILHDLRAVLPGGAIVELLGDLTEQALADAGEPVPISSSAAFRPSAGLEAEMRTLEGDARDGIEVAGGVITAGDATMIAFFATPLPGGHWPDTMDLLTFNLPEVDGLVVGVPLVADYQFVQVLPDPAIDAGIEDSTALLAARLLGGSYQYPAAGDDDDPGDLVFTGQIGRVLADATASSASTATTARAETVATASTALATTRRMTAAGRTVAVAIAQVQTAQQQDGAKGGIPPKAKPFMDGFKGGFGKCLKKLIKPGASSLKCVKEIMDGQKKGAKGTNDLINKNLGPDPVPDPDPSPSSGGPSSFCIFRCGGASGDPHIYTFDGLRYNLQLVGEFVAARDPALEVQIRTAPVPGSRTVSFVTDVAVGVAGHVIQVPRDRDAAILVDGAPVEARRAGAAAEVVGDLRIEWQMSGVDLYLAGEPLVRVVRHLQYLSMNVVGGAADGRWVGLFGDNDGVQAGDLVSRRGTVVDRQDRDFYPAFGDTWRLTAAESLFSYGSGESTETWTDLTFPGGPSTLASLPADARAQALVVCKLAGILEQPLLDECVLDYAVTGDISMVHDAQASLAASRTTGSEPSDTLDGFVSGRAAADVPGAQLAEIRGSEIATGEGLALVRTTTDRLTTLHAVDIETAEIRWSVPDIEAQCRPVVVPGLGVAAQLDRGTESAGNTVPIVLLAFDDGRELARSANVTSGAGCQLALSASGSMVIQAGRSIVTAYDAADGLKTAWSVNDDDVYFQWAPEVAGSIILFGRELPSTVRIRALDPATGAETDALVVAGGSQTTLNVLGASSVAATSNLAGDEPPATTIVAVDGGRLTATWSRDFGGTPPIRQPRQLAAFGDRIVGWTVHPDGPGVVGFDAATGEVAWTQRASSFDNSAGMVEVAGSVVAITPFGGAWIELVNASGETVATLEPPLETIRRAPDQLTALPDGRLIATGIYQSGNGVWIVFLDVPR